MSVKPGRHYTIPEAAGRAPFLPLPDHIIPLTATRKCLTSTLTCEPVTHALAAIQLGLAMTGTGTPSTAAVTPLPLPSTAQAKFPRTLP